MTRNTSGKVVVAMSGGVDSSVAAALLRDQGYEVVGCFMRLGSEDSVEEGAVCGDTSNRGDRAAEAARPREGAERAKANGCCSVEDAADARLVAAKLDMPFYVMNFKKDFDRVMDYFVSEYNVGRTPNPCVRCNDWLKFGKLHAFAQSIEAKYVATGHYAQIAVGDADGRSDSRPRLLRGIDGDKDQSYVLFGTPREQLAQMLLPIGHLHKHQVRELANEYDLPVFDKPDSQEICFVPDNDYAGLVKRRSPKAFAPGDIVDTAGKVVGRHEGHQHFTIGQRRGTGVALGYPIYVTHRDAASNRVTVGSKEDLLASGCVADQTNWLIDPQRRWTACQVKIRYNSSPTVAQVRAIGEDELEVRFAEPLTAVTPGQAVVCYNNAQVIGGGWIRQAVEN